MHTDLVCWRLRTAKSILYRPRTRWYKKTNRHLPDQVCVLKIASCNGSRALTSIFLAGTIAEREHSKWEKAAPLPNNPYSAESIEKRKFKSLFGSRSSSEASLWVPKAFYSEIYLFFSPTDTNLWFLFQEQLQQRKKNIYSDENSLQSVVTRHTTVIIPDDGVRMKICAY